MQVVSNVFSHIVGFPSDFSWSLPSDIHLKEPCKWQRMFQKLSLQLSVWQPGIDIVN